MGAAELVSGYDLPFFQNMKENERVALLEYAQIRDYKKGQHLFFQTDVPDRFFIIIDGWIKTYHQTSEGEEAVLGVLSKGCILGEAALLEGIDQPFSAESVSDCKVLEIPGSVFKKLADIYPSIGIRLIRSMFREIEKLQRENEHLTLMSASQRVGCLLLMMSAAMSGDSGSFRFPYSKSVAAARLGMKSETFSRALAQLASVGVVVNGPEITVQSFKALAGHCCVYCSLHDSCYGCCLK